MLTRDNLRMLSFKIKLTQHYTIYILSNDCAHSKCMHYTYNNIVHTIESILKFF